MEQRANLHGLTIDRKDASRWRVHFLPRDSEMLSLSTYVPYVPLKNHGTASTPPGREMSPSGSPTIAGQGGASARDGTVRACQDSAHYDASCGTA